MNCPSCGVGNPSSYVVCGGCGARRVIDLGPAAPSAPVTVPAVPVPPTALPAAPPAQRFARDVTRYLCVAVQSDSGLNTRMIEHTIGAGARAVPSSPGVDLATVIKYGLAARSRQLTRDLVLIALVVLTGVLTREEPSVFPVGLLLMLAVVCGEQLYTVYGVAGPHLRRTVFDPARAPEPRSPQVRREIAEIAARDRGNVTVFGHFDPFVGRGTRFAGFEFGLSLRPKEGGKARPFTLDDAHDHVVDAIRRLGLPGMTVEDELFVSGLDLLDQLDPATQRLLLPDQRRRPVTTVGPAALRQLRDDLKSRARPYIAIRFAGWSGELVVTVLLRLALAGPGDVLYLETHYLLLPPVHERYRDVDRLGSVPTVRQFARILVRALGQTVVRVPMSFVTIARLALGPVRDFFHDRAERRAILQDRNFNYGAVYSVREAAAFSTVAQMRPGVGRVLESRYAYARHFQNSDRKLYAEMAESRIMGALVEFLDSRGYDAAELATRQMTINNGTIVGSNATVSNSAFSGGPGSSAQNLQGGPAKPIVRGI